MPNNDLTVAAATISPCRKALTSGRKCSAGKSLGLSMLVTLLLTLFCACEHSNREQSEFESGRNPVAAGSHASPTPATTAVPIQTRSAELGQNRSGNDILAPLNALGEAPAPTTTAPPFFFTTPSPSPAEEGAHDAQSESDSLAAAIFEDLAASLNTLEDHLEDVEQQGELPVRETSPAANGGNAGVAAGGREFNRLGGVVTRRDRSAEETPSREPPHEEDVAAPAPASTPFDSGYQLALGYTMLNLMEPAAERTTTAQLNNLAAANRDHKYLGVLVDGTFDWNFQRLADAVRTLNATAQKLTLVLYLTNGATQRAFDSTPIRAPFVHIDPREFRRRILSDVDLQREFSALARRVRPVFMLNKSLNPANQNVAIVMLEDNLNTSAYSKLRDLAANILGDTAFIARNPCLNCFEGNDAESLGDPIESHLPDELPRLARSDGFSLDGTGLRFDGESPEDRDLSVQEVENLIHQAQAKELRYFGLWRKARQGLGHGTGIHPDDRHYEIPTTAQLAVERSLLELAAE